MPQQTGIQGVRRQTIFDYAGTGSAHRFVQLCLAPGADVPPWRCRALTELWVRGGLLQIDGRVVVHANCFVIIEPGEERQLRPLGQDLPESIATIQPQRTKRIRRRQPGQQRPARPRAAREVGDGAEGLLLPGYHDLLSEGLRKTSHHAEAEAE